jgi:hypothetical protein
MYFGANPRNVKGGGEAKHVSIARCLYADFDGGTTIEQARLSWRDNLIPEPTVIVATGGGVHAWWRLSEPCLDMDLHCAYQKALASRLGSDRCIHDAPRLMRLPGFVNTKYDHKPLCYVASLDTDNTYSLSDFPDPTERESERVSVVAPPVPKSMSNLSHRFLNEGYVMPAGRRQTVFTVACDLAARSWDEGDAVKVIEERAQTLGLSEFDFKDLSRQIANAFKQPRLPCVGDAESVLPAVPDSALVISRAVDLIHAHKEMRRPIIKGLLRSGETMNIIAPPKTGKSWLVSNLAINASLGRKWMDYDTVESRVLLIDNELHSETTANRLPALCMAMGIDTSELANLFTLNLRGNLIDFNKIGPLLFDTIEKNKYDMVILDAFYRFICAGISENDNGAMAGIYNMVDGWAQKLDCCFVLIHHASKGNQSEKGVTDVGAGAGSISRAADTHLVLRQHEEDKHFVLDAAVRSWQPIKPKVLRFDFPLFHYDPFKEPKLKNRNSGPKLTAQDLAENYMFRGTFESLTKIHNRVKKKIPVSKTTFAEINDEAIEEGLIVSNGKTGNQLKYGSTISLLPPPKQREEEEDVPLLPSSPSLKREREEEGGREEELPKVLVL